MNLPYFRKNSREFLVLVTILLLAAFLRFYRLDEYMQFLGDQGRDALVIKQILVDHHLPAIGPPMSVGDVYLGPLYYYMMAMAMLFWWLNPVAAAGMVALIGVLTVGLIFYLTKQWVSQTAATIAALLYTLSPVSINYSRFSWNPNPVPFFTLLAFLGIYKAHRSGDFRWLILSGVGVGAAIQMHYLTLILLPIFGLLWLYELSLLLRKKMTRKHFTLGSLGAI